jgi:hypothetical protein
MFSFRRSAFYGALVFALGLPAAHSAFAQDSSSSSNPPAQQQTEQPAQANASQGTQSVQARIRMRREQRRAAAIRDVYSHRYEAQVGMGYLRFVPGKNLQRTTFYAWDVDFTRYYSQRLGVTLDGRGYYGTTFVGLNPYNVTKPAISTYAALGGPTYRFYIQPKYSISGRVMGGFAHGNFSADTNGFGSTTLGMWADGNTFAGSAALIGEYNVAPGLGLRLAPEYFITGFGSTVQYSRGFTGGFVFRFGKQ